MDYKFAVAKPIIIVLAAITLLGCAAVGGGASQYLKSQVDNYCDPAYTLDRAVFRSAVNAVIAPNSVTITCAEGLAIP